MNNNPEISSNFDEYIKVFLEENSKRNLISKSDEKFLYEKHIFDSLSIKLFFNKYNLRSGNILDIGCGGGFPCVPLAIEFPDFKVTGIDSIRKKINSVSEIRDKLNLRNLELICDRVENLKNREFDIITSRAVGDLTKILGYGLPLLKKGGYFVAYKSKKAEEEISAAKDKLKFYCAEIIDIINYTLPLEEIYERKLVCIKKL